MLNCVDKAFNAAKAKVATRSGDDQERLAALCFMELMAVMLNPIRSSECVELLIANTGTGKLLDGLPEYLNNLIIYV